MPKIDRRDFLKLVGVSAGAAATGCADPTEQLIPYVIQPEELTPGIALTYASSCQECGAGCGLHVKTREGRPIKLEGNPQHPVNKGTLCSRGQVALGWTYHPDRWNGPLSNGKSVAWDDAISTLAGWLSGAGKGEIALLGGDPGQTAGEQLDRFAAVVGAERVVYDPFAEDALNSAVKNVFGLEGQVCFDLSQTDLVVSLGSDFLEAGTHQLELSRQLSEARDVEANKTSARFVYFGSRLSLTAGNADEWIPANPGSEGVLALALARAAWDAGARPAANADQVGALLQGVNLAKAVSISGVDRDEIKRVGKALAKSPAGVVMPPSSGLRSRRAVSTASAVLLLNYLVGAVGPRVRILEAPATHPNRREGYKALSKLTAAIAEGKTKVLLVNDANPVYAYPGVAVALGKAKAAGKAPKLVSFSPLKDETSVLADLVLPNHAPLESWGDRVPRPGVRSLQQPTFRPLKDTRATVDVLWAAAKQAGAQGVPLDDFAATLKAAWADAGSFHELLQTGGVFADPGGSIEVSLSSDLKIDAEAPLVEGDGEFTLLPIPSPLLGDGSGANLPWLQEIADPVTKLTWKSYVEISKNTARSLEVSHGDIVNVTTPAGSIEVPVYVRGGIMDNVIALATGQGHSVGYYAADRENGGARGVNVNDLLPAEATDEDGGRAWLTVKASLATTGEAKPAGFIIKSDNKRGRDLGEVVQISTVIAAAAGHGGHSKHGGAHHAIKEFDATFDSDEKSPYRWGMTIDLDKCTGCSACIAACYTENNIPVVGELETVRGRNMDWIRLERWIGEGDTNSPNVVTDRKIENRWGNEEVGNNDVRNSPMTCQHCGAAPCEQVCPVIGTYHNGEGLNVMVYNRCVGTRYCGNNCSYKVRKFNFWDFSHMNWPGDLALMLNPDVTVRGRGVMEKCSFCVQRIHTARQPAMDEKRDILSHEVQMACQQTCPTSAITFGNLKETGSDVAKKGSNKARSYHALMELNTRPAITYLKKVKRGEVKG